MNTSLLLLWTSLAAFGGDSAYVDNEPPPLEPTGLAEDSEASIPMSERDPLSARLSRRERMGRRTILPPIRSSFRFVFREQLGPRLLLELGTQLAHTKVAALDLNVSYALRRMVALPGPRRHMTQLTVSSDLMFGSGRFLKVGPSGGVGYRAYDQQEIVARGLVPVAGVRATSALVQARTWSLSVTALATVDLMVTNLVMESAQVHRLSPFEGQIGMRCNFGRWKETMVQP